MQKISAGAEVALIGAGVMGAAMGANLLKAGFRLTVHTRTREKTAGLLSAGATWAPSVKEACAGKACVVTMVGLPNDVRTVYFGENGILVNAQKGALLIDTTTSEPTLAKAIFEEAKTKGLHALDAPVSGGDVGARNGALTIMVGGDREAFDAALPLLEAMGKTIVRQGPAGSGQHTKLCNQIVITGTMIGAMEALIYAIKSGLDPETVLKSLSAGSASSWTLQNLVPRVIHGDFKPGFYVHHFLKDMGIALKEAEGMGLPLPGLKLAQQLYQELSDIGGANLGTQALFKVYEKKSRRA